MIARTTTGLIAAPFTPLRADHSLHLEAIGDYARWLHRNSYHMPSMSGVSIPVCEFLRMAGMRIPSLAGIKFTYEDLYDYQQGDEAQAAELQALAVRMIDAFVQCGAHPIAAFKWFMGQVAVDCGPVRAPLAGPTPAQLAALEARLEASGIFAWVQRQSEPARA